MLIFQLLVYPRIVKRIGPTKSQRWACSVVIPVFLAYPFLSQLHGRVLMAASLALLFFTNVAANTVGATFSSIWSLSRMLLRPGCRTISTTSVILTVPANCNAALRCWCAVSTILVLLLCDIAECRRLFRPSRQTTSG